MADDGRDVTVLSHPYMVKWFSPTLLVNAAIRAMVSPVFGTFADARAAQANVDGFDAKALEQVAVRYDLTRVQPYLAEPARLIDESGAVWLDYIADTGDGFDSSYAMASLVAAKSLTVMRPGSKVRHELPAGQIVIFGGDQVYPYPSREEYRARFVTPFEMAFSDLSRPRLSFVIPGNHDWYDGLNSFDYLFCQARYGQKAGRSIGALVFPQHRSYFALRLPYNWWFWGVDIQFSDYLDAGQVQYFEAVARQMADRGADGLEHKVVLAVAVPGWQYEEALARASNSNIRAISEIAERAGAKVCAVISGDAHHYSRYFSRTLGLNLITAGGGGAFLHPTHQLYDDITYRWQGADHTFDLYCRPAADQRKRAFERAVYPSKATSFWLTWGNLLFPLWNYWFAVGLGTFYWLMTWMYSQTPIERTSCMIDNRVERRPLVENILVYDTQTCGLLGSTWGAWISDLIGVTLQAGIYQFLLGIFGLGMWFLLVRYADARRRWKRLVIGTLHFLTHVSAMISLYILVNHYGYWTHFGEWTKSIFGPVLGQQVEILRTAAYMAQMIFFGGVIAGFVWGLYLFICCAVFKRHWNDAFSALRNPDYKNFLRMKFERGRLTIYPIGLWRTPTRIEWRKGRGEDKGKLVPLIPLSPDLIDGPIVIEAATVAKRDMSRG